MPNYLCLLYGRKSKEVKRIIIKCNKVIDGVGDIRALTKQNLIDTHKGR